MFLGRDVGFMKRVAEETGLQVIPCTGIYTYDHLPQFFLNRDPDQIADLFVHDIEEGIQGTDIKAAFIKCAADEPGVNENIEKVHRAAPARASRPARRSWPTRGPPATPARARSRSSSRRASSPRRSRSPTPATATTSTTSRACWTRACASASTATASRCSCPRAAQGDRAGLLERGYADRMFLSADSVATTDWFPPNVIEGLIASGAAQDWTIRIVHERGAPRAPRVGHDGGAGADDDGRQRGRLADRLAATRPLHLGAAAKPPRLMWGGRSWPRSNGEPP